METGLLIMMDQKKTQIKSRPLDFNNLYQTHLSIQLSLDGFSFCIIDKSYDLVQKLVHIPFKEQAVNPDQLLLRVKEAFEQEKLLDHKYGSVNISHVNQLSSLVPKSLFDENHLKDYIRYSSKTFDNDYIIYDEIENHDLMNVYIPFVNVNNYLLEKYGAFEYKHFSSVLIDNLLNTYKFSEHPHFFAHLGKKQFALVVIAENKLLLYNSFTYNSKEDFLYYILFTAEQLDISTEKLELVLSGMVDKDDDLFKLVYAYIRKVSMLENRYRYSFDKGISETLKREHFTLLNQY